MSATIDVRNVQKKLLTFLSDRFLWYKSTTESKTRELVMAESCCNLSVQKVPEEDVIM